MVADKKVAAVETGKARDRTEAVTRAMMEHTRAGLEVVDRSSGRQPLPGSSNNFWKKAKDRRRRKMVSGLLRSGRNPRGERRANIDKPVYRMSPSPFLGAICSAVGTTVI
jgi:hypothetical protein